MVVWVLISCTVFHSVIFQPVFWCMVLVICSEVEFSFSFEIIVLREPFYCCFLNIVGSVVSSVWYFMVLFGSLDVVWCVCSKCV